MVADIHRNPMNSTVLPDSAAIMAAIESFREFLNTSWPIFDQILTRHDWDNDAYFVEDWLNANWNLLVSRQLLGNGADLQPFSISTKEIQKDRHAYRLETESNDSRIFVTLGTIRTSFIVAPPFDHVRVLDSEGTLAVLPWSSICLTIRQKSKSQP